MTLRIFAVLACVALAGCASDYETHGARFFYTTDAKSVSNYGFPKARPLFEENETIAVVARGPGLAERNLSIEVTNRVTGKLVYEGRQGSFDGARGAMFWHTRMPAGKYRAHCFIETKEVLAWDFDVSGQTDARIVNAGEETLSVPRDARVARFYAAHAGRSVEGAPKQGGFGPSERVYLMVQAREALHGAHFVVYNDTGGVMLRSPAFDVDEQKSSGWRVPRLPAGDYSAAIYEGKKRLLSCDFTVRTE